MPDTATPRQPAITEPSIIHGLDSDIYHSVTVTPEPAFSAGMGWDMVRKGGCAAKAWFSSPMNPHFERKEKAAFDIGSAAHLLFLEPHLYRASVSIIDADDWRTKAAKEARDMARDSGLIPLLSRQHDDIQEMREALRNASGLPFDTAPHFAATAFEGGDAEVSYFWRDPGTGCWCKSRPDYVKPGHLIDFKTSATSDPADLPRIASDRGWHIRAAHYLDGHKALTGEDAEYWFVVQEKEKPFLTTVCKLDRNAMEWGKKLLPAARAAYANCLRSGRWPGYAEQAITIDITRWADIELQDRDALGEFDPSRYFDIMKAWQAPLETRA